MKSGDAQSEQVGIGLNVDKEPSCPAGNFCKSNYKVKQVTYHYLSCDNAAAAERDPVPAWMACVRQMRALWRIPCFGVARQVAAAEVRRRRDSDNIVRVRSDSGERENNRCGTD
jgi:hypothetical protein